MATRYGSDPQEVKASEHKYLDKGAESTVYATSGKTVVKVRKLSAYSLDGVKDYLKQQVVRDKKFEMLTKKFEGVKVLGDANKAGIKVDTVKQVTFGAPVFVQSTGASEPALSGAVASAEKGAISKVIKGNAGAYVFQILNQTTRPEKFDQKAQEQKLRQQAMQAAGRFMQELYQKADVVDNRYLFF